MCLFISVSSVALSSRLKGTLPSSFMTGQGDGIAVGNRLDIFGALREIA